MQGVNWDLDNNKLMRYTYFIIKEIILNYTNLF